MKLSGEDVVTPYRRGELQTVVRNPGGNDVVIGQHIVGMNEIEERVLRDTFEQWRPPDEPDRVPSHVRDLEVCLPGEAETDYPAREDVHAAAGSELLGLGKQDLKAEADAQIGFSCPDTPGDGIDEPPVLEVPHAVPESADSRQHDSPGVGHNPRVCRHPGIGSHLEKALLDAPDVPHAVIYNGDHRRTSPY